MTTESALPRCPTANYFLTGVTRDTCDQYASWSQGCVHTSAYMHTRIRIRAYGAFADTRTRSSLRFSMSHRQTTCSRTLFRDSSFARKAPNSTYECSCSAGPWLVSLRQKSLHLWVRAQGEYWLGAILSYSYSVLYVCVSSILAAHPARYSPPIYPPCLPACSRRSTRKAVWRLMSGKLSPSLPWQSQVF